MYFIFIQSLPFKGTGFSGSGADGASGIVAGSCALTSTLNDLLSTTLEDSVTSESWAAGSSGRQDWGGALISGRLGKKHKGGGERSTGDAGGVLRGARGLLGDVIGRKPGLVGDMLRVKGLVGVREKGEVTDGLSGEVGPLPVLARSKMKAVSVKLRW